ncbi:Lipase_GDSL domain-containing protein, partial [Psidium guajava]
MAPAVLPMLVIVLLVNTGSSSLNATSKAAKLFPAILILGDSTVDTGNNNYIPTLFKGNHLPYGRDFPGQVPTGRFSNGKLAPDFIASAASIKETVPPFLDPDLKDKQLCTGVSFASGGSGLDDLTTAASGVIPMSKQLEYLKKYIQRLNKIAGEEEAKKILRGALVIISAGTNDFIFNFYDIPTRRIQFNISGYQDFLLGRLRDIILGLHDLGCRKIAVAGLPPVGCLPIQMTAKFKNPEDRKCVEDENIDARRYNNKLANLLPQIQSVLPKSKIAYADVYEPMIDMINHPHKYGFLETKKGCCGTGYVEAGPLCNELTPPCHNSSQYLFWDSIHPSESAYYYMSLFLEEQVLPQLFFGNSRKEYR